MASPAENVKQNDVDVDNDDMPKILKLSIRKNNDYRDITIRLTFRSLLLVIWMALMIILLYEVLSVWIMFLFNRNYSPRQQQRRPREEESTTTTLQDEAASSNYDQYDNEQTLPTHNSGPVVDNNDTGTDPLPLVSTRRTTTNWELRRSRTSPSSGPNKIIVLLWGTSTAYAIFYSFEATFLYINDQWYQLLGIQLLLTTSDVLTWIHLVASCKYGIGMNGGFGGCCSSLTQVCVGIKLLHVLFNIVLESKDSMFSARHVMFLLEDTTYLWCCRYWFQGARPWKLVTSFRGIVLLVVAAASCALLLSNLTSMNRITRI